MNDTLIFLNELKKWGIKACLKDGRLALYEGDKNARKHYEKVLADKLELEIEAIFELSKRDKNIKYDVEERAAIMNKSLFEAIKMNICLLTDTDPCP